MSAVLGVACLVVGILIGFGVGSRMQGTADPQLSASPAPPAPDKKEKGPLPDPASRQEAPRVGDIDGPSASSVPPEVQDLAAIEEMKLVLHSLLTTLTAAAESMQESSKTYEAQLTEQREKLKGSLGLQDMQELGAVLLKHIETMHRSNADYRHQLTTTRVLLKQQQDEVDRLQRESGMDFLTNVANRQAYDERMREMINIARRYGNVFSLLVMDIDHFKSINDNFGHLAGDNVLRDMAQLVKSTSRVSDFLARYGGEEFTYILPETRLEQGLELAEKLRRQVEDHPFMYGDTRIPVTISGGICQVKAEGDTAEELFKRADAALYRAKEGGRNRIESAE